MSSGQRIGSKLVIVVKSPPAVDQQNIVWSTNCSREELYRKGLSSNRYGTTRKTSLPSTFGKTISVSMMAGTLTEFQNSFRIDFNAEIFDLQKFKIRAKRPGRLSADRIMALS